MGAIGYNRCCDVNCPAALLNSNHARKIKTKLFQILERNILLDNVTFYQNGQRKTWGTDSESYQQQDQSEGFTETTMVLSDVSETMPRRGKLLRLKIDTQKFSFISA